MVDNPFKTNPFNINKANWEKFKEALLNNTTELGQRNFNTITKKDLKQQAIDLSTAISEAANESIPRTKANERAKPWWNDDLSQSRKKMANQWRKWKRGLAPYDEYINARTNYYTAIRQAKTNKWNEFLENAQGKEVFKAYGYTKLRKIKKLPTLISTNGLATEFDQNAKY